MPARPLPSRRARTTALLTGAVAIWLSVLAGGPGGSVAAGAALPADRPAQGIVYQGFVRDQVDCGDEGVRVVVPGEEGPARCGHLDEAPPGVDVRERVSTAELLDRDGASGQAAEAAQDAGVPSAVSSGAADPTVPCDGDGSSGYRVQAMYVVEAGATNRYSDLLPSVRLWAAGVDDVVNRSAALTHGVRHVRYVTQSGGSSCVADVLNVTVPSGATNTFGATISAIQALGYTDPRRKYLMWTDANRLCGIGLLYVTDSAGQGNANNGQYPQYARIDNGCWGFGNGSNGHSVEAHELVHTLGSVFAGAPHGTTNGHCWDESDTMCYSDGTSHPMVQVCSPALEYLLDCNADDYFSTYPEPGSWLATHWNTASSQFLIGGGDGTGGGTLGTPTRLGATIAVNNPAVAGLPTQAQVTVALPFGATLSSVTWKSARSDCSFDDPRTTQTQVTCAATATGSTTVTATVVDSTGAVKVVTSPLTFSTASGPRVVQVTTGLIGQSGPSQDTCTAAATPVLTRVLDVATGLPIKGLRASVAQRTASGATSTATAVTAGTGIGRTATSTSTSVTLTGASAAVGAFAAGSAEPVAVSAIRCSPSLTAEADEDATYYADEVVMTGRLTRDQAGTPIPLVGVTVALQEVLLNGKVVSLASVKTSDDGTFRSAVRPTASGLLRVSLPAATGWPAAVVVAGALEVSTPNTEISGSAAGLDVGYASPLAVAGTLRRVAGESTRALASAVVTVRVVPASGPAVVLGSARTTADGSWRLTTVPKASGRLTATYAGAAGQPAATAELGTLVVGAWTPSVAVASAPSALLSGASAKVTGTVTRAYGEQSGAAAGVSVKVVLRTTSGAELVLGSATTSSAGAWAVTVAPKESGTVLARVSVPGYVATDSEGHDLAVTTRLSAAAPRSVASGVAVPVTVTVSAPRALAVVVEQWVDGSWRTVATATTSTSGGVRISVPAESGTRSLRVRTEGDARGDAATTPTFLVTSA